MILEIEDWVVSIMGNDNMATSRTELIKRARESCSRGLIDDMPYSYNHSSSKKSKGDTVKLSEDALKVKFFVIRTVIAIVILFSVIFIDKFNVTFKSFSSNQISNLLRSNHLYDVAKGYVGKYVKNDKKTNKKEENDIENVMNEENKEKIHKENEEVDGIEKEKIEDEDSRQKSNEGKRTLEDDTSKRLE